MEAIILERPCITTDFDGLPALLQNGKDALIVSPDVNQIASALKTLIEDAGLRAALSEATKHVPLNFPNKTAILYEIMEGANWEEE
jgi:glycosyltransferase involved in cell wall biosynthesis